VSVAKSSKSSFLLIAATFVLRNVKC
jgi:hypothetical protein